MNIESPHKALDLTSTIEEGDVRCLLMVLVHMTGDERWLEPPYLPKRDIRLIPDPEAGVPREVQDEIRAAVVKLFADGPPKPVITDPGDELLLKMMRACLGENVSPEYAPLMREEMGFVPREARWAKRPSDEKLAEQHVLIVGAGVCAIALGVALGHLGIPYTIVEKNEELGGTWWINRYPGCGVDTPNHSYSYSFGSGNAWTRYFCQREELHGYLLKVADEYGIRKHLRVNTELTSSRWDEGKRRWISTLRTENGAETFESTALVSAIGQLNDPSRARFEGEEDFKGTILHSALWSSDTNIDGKHVTVIGTGATSMQLVPAIAGRVASVTVYQRSAQWARPVQGYADPISEGARWLLAHLPFYVQWYRFNMFWRYGDGLLPFLRKDPAWPHPERAVNKGNDRHRQELTDFIRSELKDRPDLIEKCVPNLSALWQAHPARQQLVQDLDAAERGACHRRDRSFRPGRHRHRGRQASPRRRHRGRDRLQGHGDGRAPQHQRPQRQGFARGLGQRQSDRVSRPHGARFPKLLLHAGPEFRSRAWRQRHLPVGMSEPLHLRLPRRHDRARRRSDRRPQGRAGRLRPEGRCRARDDDLDSSRHEHLLSQFERPRVFRNALALRRLLAHDA
ncbi:hypothetical protein ACVW0I_003122 [Bradyrhizobium sp. LM6.11]